MNLSEITQKQKIIAGAVGFIFFVTAIVGIYFGFIKKDTPKPTPTPTPTKAVTNSPVTNSPATKSPATLSPAEAKAKDLEFVIIKGFTEFGEPFEFWKNNSDSTREKDKLISDNEGCFSSVTLGGISGRKINITEVTLPSDVRAKAWVKGGEGSEKVCGFNWKADIKPSETKKFLFGDNVKLKFMKA